MMGMERSPTAVVTHFLAGPGHDTPLLSSTPVKVQILLMVKPGIATDASPCQISVSTIAHPIRDRFLLLSSYCFCKTNRST